MSVKRKVAKKPILHIVSVDLFWDIGRTVCGATIVLDIDPAPTGDVKKVIMDALAKLKVGKRKR